MMENLLGKGVLGPTLQVGRGVGWPLTLCPQYPHHPDLSQVGDSWRSHPMVGTGLWGSLSPRALLIVPKSMGTISLAGMVASSRVPTHGGDTGGVTPMAGGTGGAQRSEPKRSLRDSKGNSFPAVIQPGLPRHRGAALLTTYSAPPAPSTTQTPPRGLHLLLASLCVPCWGQHGMRTSGLPGP